MCHNKTARSSYQPLLIIKVDWWQRFRTSRTWVVWCLPVTQPVGRVRNIWALHYLSDSCTNKTVYAVMCSSLHIYHQPFNRNDSHLYLRHVPLLLLLLDTQWSPASSITGFLSHCDIATLKPQRNVRESRDIRETVFVIRRTYSNEDWMGTQLKHLCGGETPTLH